MQDQHFSLIVCADIDGISGRGKNEEKQYKIFKNEWGSTAGA